MSYKHSRACIPPETTFALGTQREQKQDKQDEQNIFRLIGITISVTTMSQLNQQNHGYQFSVFSTLISIQRDKKRCCTFLTGHRWTSTVSVRAIPRKHYFSKCYNRTMVPKLGWLTINCSLKQVFLRSQQSKNSTWR